ncbi:prepilin peptidase [Butyrivibrio sp. XPD2002]|uniref:prepilin peptidase n=1 Tax=Butyrivibrio sp. XPD2002 TaxID=1280665 RepID=UPI0003FF3CD2|nr:prepilin peptidase [Butyrivibrio sp. XPD2002]
MKMEILNSIDSYYGTELMFKAIALILLSCAAIFDIRSKKIPVSFPFVQILLSFIYCLYQLSAERANINDLLLSLFPGVLLIIICFISRQGLGLGDGLMALSLGPVMGMTDMMLAIFIGFCFSAIASVILLAMHRVNGKSTLAFIPFLTAGVGVMSFAFN